MSLNKRNMISGLALLVLSGTSQASLIDRGGGLIYDDVLKVTWLQDANYAQTSGYDSDGKMEWSEAKTWAANLTYAGYDDWRLPDAKPVNNVDFQFSRSFDGSTDYAYNITSTQSEMGYMFYVNLENAGLYDISGNDSTECSGAVSCLTKTGPFNNLKSHLYWLSEGFSPNNAEALAFDTYEGLQDILNDKGNQFYAWAVRSGDVTVVPVPATIWFMSTALLGLVGFTRKQ